MMLSSPFFTMLLTGVLSCAQAPPKSEGNAPAAGPKIEVTLKDVPAADGRPPRFAVEGKADVPSGHELRIYLYFGILDPGTELSGERVAVRNGTFAHDFTLFKTKNLAGSWILQTVYDPNLQTAGSGGSEPTKVVTPLRIGTELDAQQDRKFFSERLAAELRAVTALGEEVQAKSASKPRPEGPAWDPILKDWRTRATAIQRRALPQHNPEYRVLGISLIADSGLETLIGILNAAAVCAKQGQLGNVDAGLQRLNDTVQKYVGDLAAPRLNEPHQIAALLRTLQDLLRETLAKAAEPVLPRKRLFIERMQILDLSLPANQHDLVQVIQTQGAAFFNAIADQKPEAKALLEDLDKRIQSLAGLLPR